MPAIAVWMKNFYNVRHFSRPWQVFRLYLCMVQVLFLLVPLFLVFLSATSILLFSHCQLIQYSLIPNSIHTNGA